MWRRLAVQLRTLAPARSAPISTRSVVSSSPASANVSHLRRSFSIFARQLNTESGNVAKRVEDVMPIATGHEREELEAQLQGRDILEIDHPSGPFGTKDYEKHTVYATLNGGQVEMYLTSSAKKTDEAPAVIKSYYDKRIVGCPGVEGEDEHDVVWFWLEKGKPHECPVCSQYFVLEVVGPGGSPDGHGDDEDHHHHH